MAEPDPSIWKKMEKNGLVYYRALSDNGVPYYWSGKESNGAQWEEPVPTVKATGEKATGEKATAKKVVVIGREPKPEYRKEYDDLLKLSLLELQKSYGEYKERAEFKLKKVVNIIRPLLEAVPQGLTEKEVEKLDEILNEKERAAKRRSMIEKRLKNRQAHNSIGPEETAKLQQVVDMYDNWYTLKVPKNDNEDIYKENIAKVMVGLLRNYIDYIPTYPKAEDVEPAIKDAELVSEFFSLFPSDVKSKLQKVRGGLVILNKKMGAESLEKQELQAKAKEFPLPQRKPTARETRKLERNRKIFKEQANLEENLGKRSRIRPGTKRVFPMSPPPPLKNHPPLGPRGLRPRGKIALRKRGTVRPRGAITSWNPRIRIPSTRKGGPGAPKASKSMNTPQLPPHSPLPRSPQPAKRIPPPPPPGHVGPWRPPPPPPPPQQQALLENAKELEALKKELENSFDESNSNNSPKPAKAKRWTVKRLQRGILGKVGAIAKSLILLSQSGYVNAPALHSSTTPTPFKGALVPLGPPRRGPGPGARPPEFNSSGTGGPEVEPNFKCPAGSQPGAGGTCVPKPKPTPTAKPKPKPTPTIPPDAKQKMHHQLCGVCAKYGSPLQDCPYFKEFLRKIKHQTWDQWKDDGDIHEYKDWLCSEHSKCVDLPKH